MSGLVARIEISPGVWADVGAIFANLTGTPLVSADASDNGFAISDVYALSFTDVDPGVSATVHVAAGSSANPYGGQDFEVDLDGATAYTNIIPGCELIFSDDGDFDDTWEATVVVGISFGVRNAFPPDAGTASGAVEVRVYNTGADTGSGCKARLVARLKAYARTGTVFARMRTFAETAVQKQTGEQIVPYAVTVSDVAGSGAAKTMTLEIDGEPFDTLNLTDDTTGDNTGLGVVDYYRVTSGDLEDMEFLLSEDAEDGDVVNVLVFSQAFAQIAPDVGGAPGDWGTADVDLTEDGEAVGDITAGGYATFWLRVLVPAGGNSASNPYIIDIALEGSALGAAGWSD